MEERDNEPNPERKKRGGKRRGAGAPKGNLNAMKHGRYSKQFAEIGAMFARDPVLRDKLLEVGERHNLKTNRANEVAALMFRNLFIRAREIGRGEHALGLQGLNLNIPADDSESINQAADRALARQLRDTARMARKRAEKLRIDELQS